MLRYLKSLITAALFAAVALVACGEAPGPASRNGDISDVAKKNKAVAVDVAWGGPNSSGIVLPRQAGETHYSHFMRGVEQANLRRRTLGLAFWDAYPEDQRRYTWLLETVLMPPHYASDPLDWASRARASLDVNAAEIDAEALTAWQTRYPELRAAFWVSDGISDKQRRLLWYGELENKMRLMRNTHERGQTVDPAPFLDAFLAFVAAYPTAFADNSALQREVSVHNQMLGYLWGWTFLSTGREVFDWTPENALAFLDKLDGLGVDFYSGSNGPQGGKPSLINELRQTLETTGDLPTVRRNGRIIAATSEAGRTWRELEADNRLTYHVALDRGNTGWVLHHYYDLLERVRHRAVGEDLWDSHPDHEKRWRWLYDARLEFYFGDHFVEDIRALAADYERPDLSENTKWRDDWEARYLDLREELLNLPETQEADRARFFLVEARRALGALRRTPSEDALGEQFDNQLAQTIDLLHTYHREYSDYSDNDPLSRQLVTRPDRFGLSIQDLIDFVEPYRGSRSARLQEVVGLVDRRIAFLRDGDVVDLAGPLFAGGDLNIADLRGKIVYIDPWTTTCAACIAAMPELHEAYLEYKDRGFAFVSLVYNAKEDPRGVQRYVDRMGLTWPIIVGDDIPGERLPYLLLNRDGTVYAFHDRKKRSLASLLDEMLAAEE